MQECRFNDRQKHDNKYYMTRRPKEVLLFQKSPKYNDMAKLYFSGRQDKRSTYSLWYNYITGRAISLSISKFGSFQGRLVLNLLGISKTCVPHLCGYCGGAVDSIISVFTQLHRSSLNLEFETLYESI